MKNLQRPTTQQKVTSVLTAVESKVTVDDLRHHILKCAEGTILINNALQG